MTNGVGEFCPDWVSAPGETIVDILRERNVSLAEFARGIEQTPEQAMALLEGRASISIALARRLERSLGASLEFWISRDLRFRSRGPRLQVLEAEWLASLPVGDMIRFGWLRPAPLPSEELGACLRYFGVPSIQAWHHRYARVERAVAFRTSTAIDSTPGAVAAWLRKGELEAEEIACGRWNQRTFEDALSRIRALTKRKDPRRFLPELQEVCAASGVAVVTLRAPAGSRASGATRFLTSTKALLLLSFRYLSDDHFWFTFFHEAGHLLLHGKESLFLEGADTLTDAQEEEANEFAAHKLIPAEFEEAFGRLRGNSREVIRLAVHAGVSPGIVVGQLQHAGRLRQNQLNGLKRRYRWNE